MNQLLQEAFKLAADLTPEEQDRFARFPLADHRAAATTPLDPADF